MFTANYTGYSDKIVQEWSHPANHKTHSHSSENGCNCQIITPQIHNKIAEFYNHPDHAKRHEKALKNLKKANVVRINRGKQNIELLDPNLAHVVNENVKDVAKLGKTSNQPSKKPVVKVYETASDKVLPGVLKKSDQLNSNDIFINEAFYGAKNTLKFWLEVFKRNSFDNKGADIISSVGTKLNYDNAYWNGSQMFYGKGDAQIFTRFTIDSDIIGHELGHAMTDHINSLVYESQSGAINEHISDVLGIMVKQYFGGKSVRDTFSNNKITPQKVDESNWLIGEEVLIDIKGVKYALRSMEKPGTAYVNHPIIGTDDQPNSFADYKELPLDDDNGGVHKYSGFLNRAFCLAAKKLGGYAWDHVGPIWYDALFHLKPNATFIELAKATIQSAETKFGAKSKEADAVRYAWAKVNILGQ